MMNIVSKRRPRLTGEALMSVAHSIQIMNRIAAAIRKLLRILRDSGKGRSNDTIRFASLLRAPIAQMLQEILAPTNAPTMMPGHASDHIMTAARFFNGSVGPKKRSRTIARKTGTKALCRIAGKSGLNNACRMGRSRKRS